jgi:hypothetical protein
VPCRGTIVVEFSREIQSRSASLGNHTSLPVAQNNFRVTIAG